MSRDLSKLSEGTRKRYKLYRDIFYKIGKENPTWVPSKIICYMEEEYGINRATMYDAIKARIYNS